MLLTAVSFLTGNVKLMFILRSINLSCKRYDLYDYNFQLTPAKN